MVSSSADYTAYGVRFYKIYDQPGKTQGVAFLKCQNEGGQLAVLDTPEKFDEFEQAIAKFGELLRPSMKYCRTYYFNLLIIRPLNSVWCRF